MNPLALEELSTLEERHKELEALLTVARQLNQAEENMATARQMLIEASGDDRDVVGEIAPGVQVTMLRRAVMDVVSDDQPMPETINRAGSTTPSASRQSNTSPEPGDSASTSTSSAPYSSIRPIPG